MKIFFSRNNIFFLMLALSEIVNHELNQKKICQFWKYFHSMLLCSVVNEYYKKQGGRFFGQNSENYE